MDGVGDFGVVSISPAADSNVEEAGVVLFWSPELVQRKIVNRKVDIWALGIVILEILNGGKAPYEDDRLDEEEVKFDHVSDIHVCNTLHFIVCRSSNVSWRMANPLFQVIFLQDWLICWIYV